MIRVPHPFFPPRLLLFGAGEIIVIGVCFVLATWLVLGSDAQFELGQQEGLLKIGLISFVCVFCLYLYDLYDLRVFANRRELIIRTSQTIGSATITLGLIYYIYPSVGVGRSTFVVGIPLLFFGLVSYRLAFLWLTRVSPFGENTVVLGDGRFAVDLAREIERRPELGFRFVGLMSENGCKPGNPRSDGVPMVGTTENLISLVTEHSIHRVVVAMQDRRGKLPVHDLLHLKARGIAVEEGIKFYEFLTGKITLQNLTPSWLVFTEGFAVSRLRQVCIRAMSMGLAAIGLLLSAPLMMVLALLIRIDSRGTVFLRQERVGKGGRAFELIKFRSMYDGAEAETGPVWARENDPRITRVGRFMRRWRLDELPQFFNVLRGHMNLVGPRPERPCFVEELRQKLPFHDYRHVVKPGITGWAQIKYHYADSELTNMEKLQYDLFYCKNRSVGLDLVILFHTIKIVLLGRGAR